MTEASSCKKSYFGAYLRYRLGRMGSFLLVGLILNLMVLPLQGLLMLIRANRLYNINMTGSGGALNYTVMGYITMFGVLAAFAGLAFTMTCAVSSYNFFCKKESVDTLGVLAVTYKQRFWGDFLGGFIPCVGVFIPSALIGVLLTSIAQNKLNTVTIDDKHINIMPFFLGFTLALFFAYLFVYLLTTLAAACCGRISSMIIFTVISFAAIPVLGISVSKFITLEAVGVSDTLVNQVQQLCMPAGFIFSPALQAMAMMIDERNEKLILELSELEFAVISPVSIVILIVAAVLILALAYFAGKSRKQENVGRMFVKPVYFHIVAIIMSLGGFFIVASAFRNSNRRLIIPIGLGVSLIIAVIFEVVRIPRVRQLPKAAARWIVTVACSIGLMLLISGTGAFGLINIPADVQSVKIEFYENNTHRELELTDHAEITEFLEVHNKSILKNSEFMERPDDAYFTSGFSVSYITANGDEVIRGYTANTYGYDRNVKTVDTLSKNVLALSFYPEKSAEMLSGNVLNAKTAIAEILDKIPVPTERLGEFTQTLRQDILDHYDANAATIGTAEVAFEESSVSYPIQSSYENTIRLIREYNNDIEKALDAKVMDIKCLVFEDTKIGSETYRKRILDFDVTIRERDLRKPKVKELLGLMKVYESSDDDSNLGTVIGINSENGINYFIPPANRKYALKLVAQIAAELVE
ncbi:MAG: hypothetical protein K2N06_07165 [Oscillospiraceae bacterium]|nr:hypothetical protein [Oscillospiraceae bacterium]